MKLHHFLLGSILLGTAGVPGFGQTRLSVENHSLAFWYLQPKQQQSKAQLVCFRMGNPEPSYEVIVDVGPTEPIVLPPRSVIRLALLGVRPKRSIDLERLELLDMSKSNPCQMNLASRWDQPLPWQGGQVPNVGTWVNSDCFVLNALAYPGLVDYLVDGLGSLSTQDSAAPGPVASPEAAPDETDAALDPAPACPSMPAAEPGFFFSPT